ncbi:hypothetical protein MATR_11260 [Marivirga tractuosa]|uniref:Uncharacterized protein n=2 Tax=Marivirga TaxID=869806 RepID=E4TLC4_MARTH|nr:hypothetical protein Ftrac_1254 [Marivirga tractuosa DSM 4126]BDD14301.1 hypothetical protein MATR_11260 [Marivirga tractuosa]
MILLTLITIFLSCSESDVNKSAVNIRLANTSIYDYENIIINTTTGDVNFGDLKSGSISDYKVFETAYRYAYVKLEINGNIFRIQPIDYVGETPLKNGNYTYEIHTDSPNEEYGALSIELVVD